MSPFVGSRRQHEFNGELIFTDVHLNGSCLRSRSHSDDNASTISHYAACIPDVTKDENKKLPKKVKRYYKSQAELLNSVLDLEEEARDDEESGETNKKNNIHSNISPQTMAQITFAINIVLLCAKVVAAVKSGSLSVMSSVLDSAVDLVCGVLLWFSTRAIKNADDKVYPRGRGRLEPVSIVILAVIMSLVSFQVAITSAQTISTYVGYDLHCQLEDKFENGSETMCGTLENLTAIFKPCMDGATGPFMELSTILICSLTIVIKFILYVMCCRWSNSTIRALAQDHRNDIISNSVALTFGFLGYKHLKYIDPIGAILIAFYIIITWSITAKEQIRVITGFTANKDLLNAFTWFVAGHHPDIKYIDDLRAFYHSGEGYVVEADIILPPGMGLKQSHDIGESLRLRLEKLSWVDKAYVHVDYACNNYKQLCQITRI